MVILWIAGSIAFIWTFLTLFAEVKGKERLFLFANSSINRTALLVYHQDLFYNLDYRSFWLIRSNDENNPKVTNVQAAKNHAKQLAKIIAQTLVDG